MNDPIMHYEFMDKVTLFLSTSQVSHVTKIYAHNTSDRSYRALLHRLLDAVLDFSGGRSPKRSPSPPAGN